MSDAPFSVVASPAVNPWTIFLTALGLAMVLEGLPYFVAPGSARATLARMMAWSDSGLRAAGLLMIAAGLALAWASLHWIG